VEPDAVPPRHGDEVAEPHVGVLVSDDVGHALLLGVRRLALVDEQRRLTERDGAEVLHGAGRKVRNGEQVELVTGIGQAVVILEEPQRGRADILAEGGELDLAWNAPHPEWRAAHGHRSGGFELADHEGHQVGGHLDRVGEGDGLAAAFAPFGDDARVGDRGERRVDDEGAGEDGFESRLIPARKRAPGVGCLELRGRQRPTDAGRILVRAAIETPQLIVEDAGEGQTEPPLARRDRRWEREPAALEILLEGHRRPPAVAAVVLDRCARDRELGRIENDLRGRLGHGERDRLGAGERRRHQIRFEPDLVARGDDVTRQPVEIHEDGRLLLQWTKPYSTSCRRSRRHVAHQLTASARAPCSIEVLNEARSASIVWPASLPKSAARAWPSSPPGGSYWSVTRTMLAPPAVGSKRTEPAWVTSDFATERQAISSL